MTYDPSTIDHMNKGYLVVSGIVNSRIILTRSSLGSESTSSQRMTNNCTLPYMGMRIPRSSYNVPLTGEVERQLASGAF